MKKHLLYATLIFALSAGCAHQPVAATPTGLEALTPGLTGLILSLTVTPENGAIINQPCSLTLQNEKAQKINVGVGVGLQTLFVVAASGSYSFTELNCGYGHIWDFTGKKWPPLYVEASKISVAAPLDFRITDKWSMTTFFSNRRAVGLILTDIFSKLRPETQPFIISGYNKKQITPKMTHHSEYQITVRLPAQHAKEGEADESNYPDFKKCYVGEFDINPLYVGFVTMTAVYKDKAFLKLESRENSSLYSESFMKCADETVRKFVPNRSDLLNYEITL